MAFIFDPNPNEGDKQTNPDTGVEYIYTSGAWRALGAKIEDQFDTLDERYVQVDGDHMTGSLTTEALIKSKRVSGYAFQVEPEGTNTNVAFIHSNGNIRGAQGTFTDSVEIRGIFTLKEGAWIAGNLGFHEATKGIRFYNDDKSTRFADITRQGIVLQNLMYGDNLWTLKVQDASNANDKTLIYADYSSGLILNEVGELNTNGNVSVGGNLSFPNGGMINASNGSTALSGRGSLEIRAASDYPIIISSGSSYKKLLAFYGYVGGVDDNRGEVAYINANGNAYFKTVYSNDEELATRGNGMRWKHATHEVAANLVAGEFFVASNGNIYLHPKSYDNVDLNVGSSATEVTGMKQLGTVHRANGESAYHITWDQISYNNGSNKYVRVTKNATHLGDSTTQGEIYRLNIPGFTM